MVLQESHFRPIILRTSIILYAEFRSFTESEISYRSVILDLFTVATPRMDTQIDHIGTWRRTYCDRYLSVGTHLNWMMVLPERPVDDKNRITPINTRNMIKSRPQSTGHVPSVAVPKPPMHVQLLYACRGNNQRVL